MKRILSALLLSVFCLSAPGEGNFPRPKSVKPVKPAEQTTSAFPEYAPILPKLDVTVPNYQREKELERCLPTVLGNIAAMLGTDTGNDLLGMYRLHAQLPIEYRPGDRIPAFAAMLVDKFNSQVKVEKLFDAVGLQRISGCVERNGAVYFAAFPNIDEDKLNIYRVDSKSGEPEKIASFPINGAMVNNNCQISFDVSPDYIVWHSDADDRTRRVETPTSLEITTNDESHQRLHVFDRNRKTHTVIKDFPFLQINSATVLKDKIYVLSNKMLLRCNPDGSGRELLISTRREDSLNYFDTLYWDGYGCTVIANPYRNTLLLHLGSNLFEVDPETMQGVRFDFIVYSSVISDERVFFKGGYNTFLIYDMRSGTISIKSQLLNARGYTKQEAEYTLTAKKLSDTQGPISYAIQGNLLLLTSHQFTMLLRLDDPAKSPPLLVLRGFHAGPGNAFAAADGKSFCLVLPEGLVYRVEPKK